MRGTHPRCPPTELHIVLAPLPRTHADYDRPKRRVGKPIDLLKHLSSCPNADNAVKAQAQRLYNEKKVNKKNTENIAAVLSTATAPGRTSVTLARTDSEATVVQPLGDSVAVNIDVDGRARQIRKVGQTQGEGVEVPVCLVYNPETFWTRQRTTLFAAMLCRLMIVCNIPWYAVERPYWRYFFDFWMPSVPMLGREELSGRILDEEAGKCEAAMKSAVQGKFATGQCDGWKDIVKTSIIAVMMNVEYLVRCHRSAVSTC